MAECVSTGQSAAIEDVVGGDCILVVGPEMVRVHADSQFLSAVSGPFRAMLGPEWKEGDNLRGLSSQAEIPLPEDDPLAVQLLCAVIHHQTDTIPRELPSHIILNIAVTADKYDCTRALKYASESWLRSDPGKTSNLLVLAAAAYLLENATAF